MELLANSRCTLCANQWMWTKKPTNRHTHTHMHMIKHHRRHRSSRSPSSNRLDYGVSVRHVNVAVLVWCMRQNSVRVCVCFKSISNVFGVSVCVHAKSERSPTRQARWYPIWEVLYIHVHVRQNAHVGLFGNAVSDLRPVASTNRPTDRATTEMHMHRTDDADDDGGRTWSNKRRTAVVFVVADNEIDDDDGYDIVDGRFEERSTDNKQNYYVLLMALAHNVKEDPFELVCRKINNRSEESRCGYWLRSSCVLFVHILCKFDMMNMSAIVAPFYYTANAQSDRIGSLEFGARFTDK